MGNECTACCNIAEEGKQELNDDSDSKVAPGYQSYGLISTSKGSSTRSEVGRLPSREFNSSSASYKRDRGSLLKEENLAKIIQVQALVKGFLQRRRYRIMKLTCEVQSKYFKSEEAKETLEGIYVDNS